MRGRDPIAVRARLACRWALSKFRFKWDDQVSWAWLKLVGHRGDGHRMYGLSMDCQFVEVTTPVGYGGLRWGGARG